jgi:hypothetical protein
LSKDESGKAALLMAARGSHVKLLQKMWHFAEELQLNPKDLRHEMWSSKDMLKQRASQIAAREGHVEIVRY